MDTNKILSADLLDLVFDNRNKDYGAYELRKTYHTRITKALVFTGMFVFIVFTGVVLANKIEPSEKSLPIIHQVNLINIPEDKQPDPIPQPPRQSEPPQVHTERNVPIQIVPDEQANDDPPPTQKDLADARIGLQSIDGVADGNLLAVEQLDEHKDIIEEKVQKDEGPVTFVEVQARFNGNWEKFLLRNLNAEVPVNNGAPEGSYTVLIQFVVDVDGTVSDIKALTNHGYGLEEEAIRVLRKATKWEPGIQNGYAVKSYRRQPITFRVASE